MFFNSSYTQIRQEHSSKRENVNFILSDRRRAKTTKTPGTVPECYLYRGLCDQSNGTFSRVRDERDDRRVINARTNGFSFLPSLLPRYFHLCPSRAAARAHTHAYVYRVDMHCRTLKDEETRNRLQLDSTSRADRPQNLADAQKNRIFSLLRSFCPHLTSSFPPPPPVRRFLFPPVTHDRSSALHSTHRRITA